MDTADSSAPGPGATHPQDGTPPQPSGSPYPPPAQPYPPPAQPYPAPGAGPAPHPQNAPGDRTSGGARPGEGSAAFFDSFRRIGVARTPDRWIGGVAAGLAHRLGVDPLIVRGAFVVLTLFGGLPLLLYGLAWALLPESTDGRIHLQEAIRGRFDAALAGAAGFAVLGVTRPGFWLDLDRWAPGWFIVVAWLGLLATVGVIALIVAGVSRPGTPSAGAHGTAPAPTLGGSPVSTPTAGPTEPVPYPAPYSEPTPGAYYPPAAQPFGGPGAPTPSGPTYGTVGYGPAPHRPVPATAPPVPAPRPRVPGPGQVLTSVILALCLFAGAGALIAYRVGVLDARPALAAAGAALALLGLGVLVSGARGRRAGALGGIAIAVAVLAVPAALVTNAHLAWDGGVLSDGGTVIGDTTWTPTTGAEAEDGLSLGAGTARIDLTAVPLGDTTGPVRVPISVGMGSTTVIVPTGVPVEVRAHVGAGQIRSVLSGEWARSASLGSGDDALAPTTDTDGTFDRVTRTELEGTNLDLALRSPEAGDLALVVTIDAGLGDVTIEEALR